MPYKLVNGRERARGSPESFWIPSDAEKADVAIGDFVKLIFDSDDGAERMWVRVLAKDGDSLSGCLANSPYRLAMKHGDPVEFGLDNIVGIIKS